MEDRVVMEVAFTVEDSRCSSDQLSLFAVFDGHGGSDCAELCAVILMPILRKHLTKETSVARALTRCIAELDTLAIRYAEIKSDDSGSTACIVLIDRATHELWCCNVG